MSASEPAWHLHNRTARLAASDVLHAQFDTHRPDAGLRDVTWREAVRIDRLFGLTNLSPKTIQPLESYVRQPDLVVHYKADPIDQVARSMYWRASSTCGAGDMPNKKEESVDSLQIELLLSLSTATLDSHPRNDLKTEFIDFAGELFVADTLGGWQALSLADLPAAHEQPPVAFKPVKRTRSTGSVANMTPSEGIILIRPETHACSIALGVYPRDLAAWRLEYEPTEKRLTVNFQLVEEFLEKGVIRRFRSACSFWPRSADRALAHRWFQQFAQSSPPLTT